MADGLTGGPASPWLKWLFRRWAWILLGLTLLLVLSVRVRLRDMPLERDEGEYAYAGQLILEAVPPYKEACNMKLPGTYAAYALIMAVFGQSPSGIHLGVALVNAASIILLFLLGRRLLDEVAGVVAAVVFALMSLSPYVLGLAGHATHFVVLPALAGTLLLLRATSAETRGVLRSESRNPKPETSPNPETRTPESAVQSPKPGAGSSEFEVQSSSLLFRVIRVFRGSSSLHPQPSTLNPQLLLASGLLFGLAFLMKQHGIFFGIFGALYLIGMRIEQRFEARQEGKGLSHGLTRMRTDKLQKSVVSASQPSTLNPQPSTPNPQPTAPARLSHFAAGKRKAEVQPQISQMSRIPENPQTESHSVPSGSSVPSVVSGSPSSLPPQSPPAQTPEGSEFKVQSSKLDVQSSPPNPAAHSLTDPLPVHPPSAPSVSSVPSVVSGSPSSFPHQSPSAQTPKTSEFKVQSSKLDVQGSPPNPAAHSLTDPLPVHPPSAPSVSSVPSVVSSSPSSPPPQAAPAQTPKTSEFKVQSSKLDVQSSPPNPAAHSLTDPLPVHPPSAPSVSSVSSVVSDSRAPRLAPQSSTLNSQPSTLNPRPLPLVTELALFAAGLALPYLVTCLLLWWAGVFHEFVFWTISYASKYASSVSLVNGPDLLKAGLHAVVGPNIVFWLLPWIGALVMWWDERLVSSEFKVQGSKFKVQRSPSPLNPRPSTLNPQLASIPSARLFLTLFLFCSFASVSVGLYFREHYFITLLPVLALLTGVAVSRALHVLRHERTLELFLALPALILMVVGLGAVLLGNASFWFGTSPAQVVRNSYSTTLFSDTMNLAAYLRTNTPSGARIAVLGSEPEIYFYSRRRSATSCLYVYPLMETHPFALKMQQDMISQIERARPEYVVYVVDPISWLRQPHSEPRLDEWWLAYWPANLDLVMTVPVESSPAPEQLPWERNRKEEKEEGKGQPPSQLLVFKRKAGL